MKKVLVAAAIALFAVQASAKIANGSHDLSLSNTTHNNYSASGPQLSSCQFCHAPHNVNTGVAGAPLWNRQNVVYPEAGNMYTSTTLKGGATQALGPNSITCLSCHDGTSDMGATYTGSKGYSSPTAVTMITNFSLGDTTKVVAVGSVADSSGLRDDHPVGVPMIDGTGGFQTVVYAKAQLLTLYGVSNTVECGSCHDPHGLSDGASGGDSFLRIDKSVLCAGCHDK
jgi:predicted CXXCH cytochrome family protein